MWGCGVRYGVCWCVVCCYGVSWYMADVASGISNDMWPNTQVVALSHHPAVRRCVREIGPKIDTPGVCVCVCVCEREGVSELEHVYVCMYVCDTERKTGREW